MINFFLFNLSVGLINIILIFILTKSRTIKIVKPKKIKDKIKFLLNDILIYLCIFLIFSIPMLNIFILLIIIYQCYNSIINKMNK